MPGARAATPRSPRCGTGQAASGVYPSSPSLPGQRLGPTRIHEPRFMSRRLFDPSGSQGARSADFRSMDRGSSRATSCRLASSQATSARRILLAGCVAARSRSGVPLRGSSTPFTRETEALVRHVSLARRHRQIHEGLFDLRRVHELPEHSLRRYCARPDVRFDRVDRCGTGLQACQSLLGLHAMRASWDLAHRCPRQGPHPDPWWSSLFSLRVGLRKRPLEKRRPAKPSSGLGCRRVSGHEVS